MLGRLGRSIFYFLTAISFVSGAWVVRNMSVNPGLLPMYDVAVAIVSQGVLTIWCLRDVYRRRFGDQRAALSWFAAILFLGVFGTTAYLLCVKRRQWFPEG